MVPSAAVTFTGITPACAGNSLQRLFPWVKLKDHPRVCGEQSFFIPFPDDTIGSPPRVRGTVDFFPLGSGIVRITPACAGNRDAADQPQRGQQDHPRVCGEQRIDIIIWFARLGSPPRVRGTDSPRFSHLLCCRITPACAGNS